MPLYMPDISTISPNDDYIEEMECDYKGEHYSVRDNSAVMRHAREGEKPRKYDNKWLFNTRRTDDGYLMFCNERTRIVVSRDPITRRVGNVEVIYLFDFLRMLWNGELF